MKIIFIGLGLILGCLGIIFFESHNTINILSVPSQNNFLVQEISLGEFYLTKKTTKSGKFQYEYDPIKDKYKNKYNFLRHSGAVFALSQAWKLSKNEDTEEAIYRGLSRIKKHIENGETGSVFVDDNNLIKLGGNALSILALLEATNTNKYIYGENNEKYRPYNEENIKLAEDLAFWIINNQDESGRFTVHKKNHKTQEISDFYSLYYPGEAAYALIKLYETTKNNKYLNAAYKSAIYTSQKLLEDGGINSEAEHDHRLLYAIERIYQYKKDPLFLDVSKKIIDHMILTQNFDTQNNIKVGSWYTNPRFTPSSTRCEGLISAYNIYLQEDDKEYINKTKKIIKDVLIFLEQGQISPSKARMLKNPNNSLGGVYGSLNDKNIRIDYVQHALSCWIGVKNVGLEMTIPSS